MERKDIPEKDRWNLEKMYPDKEHWDKDFAEAEKLMEVLPQYPGTVTDSPERLYEYLQLDQKLSMKLDKLYVYAKMKLDEDNRQNIYQAMQDKAMSLSVKAAEQTAFFVPEILAQGSGVIEGLIDRYEPLKDYRRMFQNMLRFEPHTLNQREEAILAMSGEMAETAQSAFTMFNEADLKFPEIQGADGRPVCINHANFIRLMESKSRRVRKDAYEGLYASYRSFRNTVAATLSGSVKRDVFYAKVRRYGSALEEALFADNVTTALYDNLIDTVKVNCDAFQDYLRLRKKVLGLDELHFYDVYTPLVAEEDKDIPFEEGFSLVKKALAPLGKEYVDMIQKARDDRWMDVRENEGKRSGAYSWGVCDGDPYLMLSYQDNLNSVFTMAHELGHSMHSYYSWHNQPYQYAYYKIFVAEVASIVNETLLTAYLLEHSESDMEKAYLLNQYLDEFRGTVYRQTMFAEFEKVIHHRAEQMEGLTADDMCTIYLNLNKEYFGDAIVYDDEISMEWARIPHFYNGFYVYKYATSYAAAQALAAKILSGDKEALARYLAFLKSGSSDDPNELLKKAGVDLTDPKTIEGIFPIFRERLGELASLLAKK